MKQEKLKVVSDKSSSRKMSKYCSIEQKNDAAKEFRYQENSFFEWIYKMDL